MTRSDFGIAIAEGVNRELGIEVRFVHEEDVLLIGPPSGTHARLAVANFHAMHEQGKPIESLVAQIIAIHNQAASANTMTWDEVKDLAIPHVQHHPMPGLIKLREVSPILETVAGIDGENSVALLTEDLLTRLGVSVDVFRAVADVNIERLLTENPGQEVTLETGRKFLVFECGLAADLAYAFARKQPFAAVAFCSSDFAVVSDGRDMDAAAELTVIANVIAKRGLLHAMPPGVHLFANGEFSGLGAAIPLSAMTDLPN